MAEANGKVWAWQQSCDPVRSRALMTMRAWIWSGIAAIAIVSAVVLSFTQMQVVWLSFAGMAAGAVGFAGLSAYFTIRRGDAFLATAADSVAVIFAFGASLAILTYATAYLSGFFPLQDVWLDAADKAIGFDWKALVRWLDGYPILSLLLLLAYASVPVQLAVMVFWLTIRAEPQRIVIVLMAMMLALIACAIVMVLVPAIGAYPYYGIDPARDHPNIYLGTNMLHVPHYMAMRENAPLLLHADKLEGIITFPSFHFVMAALLIWAFWPYRAFRYAALLINGAMIVSTPPHGGHYLVDLFAGAAVAAVALLLAMQVWRRAYGRALAARALPVRAPDMAPGAAPAEATPAR